MTHEELNVINLSYDLNDKIKFRLELNKKYNDLCYSIRKKKGSIPFYLKGICAFIIENWEYAKCLPREELYMVFNSIKLARSGGYIGSDNIVRSSLSNVAINPNLENYDSVKGRYESSYSIVPTTFTMQEFNELAENYKNSR